MSSGVGRAAWQLYSIVVLMSGMARSCKELPSGDAPPQQASILVLRPGCLQYCWPELQVMPCYGHSDSQRHVRNGTTMFPCRTGG